MDPLKQTEHLRVMEEVLDPSGGPDPSGISRMMRQNANRPIAAALASGLIASPRGTFPATPEGAIQVYRAVLAELMKNE